MSTTTETCEKCHDTGKIVHDTDGGGYWTDLCECRRSLPPRHGTAKWWQEESVHTDHFGDSVLFQATATVRREIPVSEDGYRLHRTADNSHFAVGADIEIEPSSYAPAHMIRDFAAWLLKLADKMDELDKPHPDEAPRGAGGERSSGT